MSQNCRNPPIKKKASSEGLFHLLFQVFIDHPAPLSGIDFADYFDMKKSSFKVLLFAVAFTTATASYSFDTKGCSDSLTEVKQNPKSPSARFMKLLGLGLSTDLSFLLNQPLDIFRAMTNATPDLISRRGVWRYLLNLHLFGYDFSGKKILDVASGKSQFTTVVNQVYGDTGTLAVALDYFAERGYEGDIYTRGDAYQLPFRDSTFDLTTSSWFLNNVWTDILPSGDMALLTAVDEMIRVTKPGGQVRFVMSLFNLNSAVDNLNRFLENHPRIEKFSLFLPLIPGTGRIKIILKEN